MKVTFADHTGERVVVEAGGSISLKDLAKANDIRGIVAECGGMCACATCHVYVDPAWLARLALPTAFETELLDGLDGVEANSRLSCQIQLDETLDGLTVTTPESQY